MIELPEALNLATQLNSTVIGKCIQCVLPPSKPHKFCWFNGDAADYDNQLSDSVITSVQAFGIYVEFAFDNGKKLCINDGVNVRLCDSLLRPKNYQLIIEFTDETMLVFTVAMYGGIIVHDGFYDNEYYIKSHDYISPFVENFRTIFFETFYNSKTNLSVKAFLATEQRFPGIGNGVLQDILFEAGVNPKRKLESLTDEDLGKLFSCTINILNEMTEKGGRNTEKDIFGNPGGYQCKLSKNTFKSGCPVCGKPITKETYMGGSVYYCLRCQPIIK